MKNLMKNILALAIFSFISTQALSQSNKESITVQGSASVSVTNTQAKIFASVNSKASTADEAMTDNNAAVQKIIDALTAAGISQDDIQTQGFTFNPINNWIDPAGMNDQTSLFEGYNVNNNLSIVVKDISTVGLILDLIISAGASRIDYVQFSPTDVDSGYLQALTQASQDARSKAEALAQASSVTLGKVIKINSNNSNSIYSTSFSNTSLDTSSAVILPGNNQVSAYVTIEYSIESID